MAWAKTITTDTFRLTVEGRPNSCFENSVTAVWHVQERLKYAEGFEITEYNGLTRFNHHAQVLDSVTGKLHEVTPGHDGECKYVYQSFWWHELYDPLEDGPLEDPFNWATQLSLKAQRDLLAEHGYSVELWAVHSDDEYPAVLDEEEIRLNESKGWRYEWRLATPQSMAAAA